MQALSGRDAEVLAACVVMHLGSPDKAVADAVREVTRILKKTKPDTLPKVLCPNLCLCSIPVARCTVSLELLAGN